MARFGVAHALGAAGDTLVTVSLAGSLFFSLSPSASQQQTLLYLGVTMVPFALLAPLIGPVIDRFRDASRWVAAVLFALRAVTALALAFTLFQLVFYLLALVILVASKSSGITKQALVPTLVDRPDDLVAANSWLARLSTVAGTVAGVTGAALLASVVEAPVILVLACSAFTLAAVAAASMPPRRVHDTTGRPSEEVEFHQLHDPTLVSTGWAFTAIRGAVGFYIFGMAFALRRTSESAWIYGAAAALYGLGVFAGNALAPWLGRRVAEDRLVAGSLFALAGVAAFGALGPSRVLVLLVSGVLGLAASIGRQGFDSLVQQRAEPATQGRAFARFETRFQLGWVVGALVATGIGIPIRVSLAVLALGLIPAAWWFERSIRQIAAASRDGPADLVTLAGRRLASARTWHLRDDDRVAVTELRGAVDLALAAGIGLDWSITDEVDRLRVRVIRGQPLNRDAVADLVDRLGPMLAGGRW